LPFIEKHGETFYSRLLDWAIEYELDRRAAAVMEALQLWGEGIDFVKAIHPEKIHIGDAMTLHRQLVEDMSEGSGTFLAAMSVIAIYDNISHDLFRKGK
jgi:hypothetical protein